MTELLDYTADELTGRSMYSLVHAADTDKIRQTHTDRKYINPAAVFLDAHKPPITDLFLLSACNVPPPGHLYYIYTIGIVHIYNNFLYFFLHMLFLQDISFTVAFNQAGVKGLITPSKAFLMKVVNPLQALAILELDQGKILHNSN